MIPEAIMLLCQAVTVAFLAGWLTTGAWDNWRYPAINETFTAEVMEMARLRAEYPTAYEMLAHRQITNRRLQQWAFRLVVIWEWLATAALWGSTALLLLALGAGYDPATARGAAMIAVLMFSTTWALFLIVGNYFCYWFGHEGAQNTHYQMVLWGMAVMILLALGEGRG